MHAHLHIEALGELEALALLHFRWLRAVHAVAFMQGGEKPPALKIGPALERWAESGGSGAEILDRTAAVATLQRLARDQERQAADLLAQAGGGGQPAHESYAALMTQAEVFATELRRLQASLHQELAKIDPLTGVHNRQGMLRDLSREWTRAMRTDEPCAVGVLDLDHFKRINDTYGHIAGDKVLCATARFLRRRLRPYDLLYRFGGEEFLLCLPNADIEQALQVLERIRRLMARLPVRVDHTQTLGLTCSIGLALMRPRERPMETVARADQAMYAAKAAGRNRVCVHPDDAPSEEDDASPTDCVTAGATEDGGVYFGFRASGDARR